MTVAALIRLRERFHPLHRLRRSPFVARRVLPLFDQPVFIRMHGVGWPVRVRRMRHLSYLVDNRMMEPGIVALFRALQALIRPRVFRDVGANVGFYSWLLMNDDDDLVAVLFEPDPDNLALLRDTVGGAGLAARAELVARAASDRVGEARFVVDAASSATSHLEAGGAGAAGRVVTVATTTLDAELAHRAPPQLVKIDVEGAEALVLAGAGRLIDAVRPAIMLECFGGTDAPPLRRLAAAGYTFLCADDLAAPAGTTGNYLCLPPGHGIDRVALAAGVRDEYARWIGEAAR
jgi:FkbM family methyltransferase